MAEKVRVYIREEKEDELGVAYYADAGAYTVNLDEAKTVASDSDGCTIEFERDGATIRAHLDYQSGIWETYR